MKKAIALLLLCIGLLGLPPAAAAALERPGEETISSGKPEPPRMVLVFLPGLDWPEFRDALAAGALPNLSRLVRGGALGLINAQTGGRFATPGDAYATMGTGVRAAGGEAAGEAMQAGEEIRNVGADQVYRVRLGQPSPGGEVLHVGLPSIARASGQLPYPVRVGALGEALHAAGVPTAVVGNADVIDPVPTGSRPGRQVAGPGRFAAAVVMDQAGVVDRGRVDRLVLTFDPAFPGGWRSDYAALEADALASLSHGGVAAVETGDLRRLQAEEERMAPGAYAAARRQALVRADGLVGTLAGVLDRRRDLLLILSPYPSDQAGDLGAFLTPALAWGRGVAPGLLTSATTRGRGLAANIDVAPTVLAAFGIGPPPFIYGQPLSGIPTIDQVGTVDALYRRTLANHIRRPLLVKAYITLQIVVLLAALAGLALRLSMPRVIRPLLVALTAVPLAYLLLALWPLAPPATSCLIAAGLTAALTALALLAGRGDPLAPFALVAAVTAAAVAGDALTGSRLMETSPLGHSLIAGARFYGIGNEYMGVLLGASLIAGAVLLDRLPAGRRGAAVKGGVLAAWTGILFVLASPAIGANFGGTAAVAAAYAVIAARLASPRLRPHHLLAAAGFAVLVLAAAAAFDAVRDVSVQSHLGRAAAAAERGDWRTVADMATRKVAMNIKLIRWTRWSLLFLISLGIYAWWSLRPPAPLARALARRAALAAGFTGVAAGSLAALVLNDSGIVAAATAMIFASAPLIDLLLNEAPARDV